ncbi:MAG: response regulator transcription factor [Bacillota bacterium]|nr:response regulator transcription factor [Bacillota bacterium]
MNSGKTILVVEDEASISNFICSALEVNGYGVVKAASAGEARSLFLNRRPDAVLLDLGLPDEDGMGLIGQMQEWAEDVPVIVVSAREREAEKVKALDEGAEDYITKPFGISELLARVRRALRRAERQSREPAAAEVIQVKDLVIDLERHTVTVGERPVHFTQNEFKLLALLGKYRGKVLTYDFIIKEIWGAYAANGNQTLRVNMANIRKKLQEDPVMPRYVLTELGVGYRMLED